MEDRLTPAGFWWDPMTDNLSTTANNWLAGPGIPFARRTVAPGPQDDLYFDGGVSSADCVIPQPAAPAPYPAAFNGLHLVFGLVAIPDTEETAEEGGPPVGPPPPNPPPVPQAYVGTVTTAGSFAVGTLTVECGAILQADPTAYGGGAGTLTVTSFLDWTGGTLNSGPIAGTIALAPGATGVVAPTDEGTVFLGSELRLLGDGVAQTGSTLTLNNGTINVNGGRFHATAGSLLMMAPAPMAPSPPSTPGTPSITLKNENAVNPLVTVDPGAKVKITSVGRTNGNTTPVDVKITGSGVEVANNGTVEMTGYTRLIMAKLPLANFAAYLQIRAGAAPAPITKLQAGCEIVFEDDGDPQKGCVDLRDGELQLYGLPQVNDPSKQVAAIKNLSANPTAPALYVGSEASVTVFPFSPFVKLAITGDFTCKGEVHLRAFKSAGESDRITATGLMRFEVGQGGPFGVPPAKLVVTWTNPGGDLPAVDTKWELLAIDGENGGIVNNPTTVEIPSIDPPSTLTHGRFADTTKYGMTFVKVLQ